MTLHPSRFIKRADGTRFSVVTMDSDYLVYAHHAGVHIATCNNLKHAEMVAAALEFQARDGEAFEAEERKCKPT